MAHLFLSALAAILFPVFVSDSTLHFSNSIFSLIACIAVFLLLRHAGRQPFSARLKRFSHGLGLLFSLMTAYGCALGNIGSISYFSPALIAAIAVYTHVYAQAIALLWQLIDRKEADGTLRCLTPDSPSRAASALYRAAKKIYQKPALLFFLLLLCWAPCYISTFPGNFVYDASYEYYQLKDGFTRSYPLLHSVIITRLLAASEALTGSINPGIGVYTVVQLLCSAALLTHILRRFYLDSIHPALLSVLTLYYAAFPVIHFLVTCTTRDVLFSVMILWLAYLFYLLVRDPEGFFAPAKNMILLAAVLVIALLARNNNSGPLALLLLIAVCALMLLSFGRRYLKRILLFTASSIALFYGVSALCVALCQPLYDSPLSSSLSTVAQPIVRAYMLHGEEWPEEDRATFESYFNMNTLEYFPQNADPAKGNLLVRYANIRDFIAFWIKIGLRHPACYVDAVLHVTRQMWFPGCVLDGYTVRGMFPAYEKNYFYFGKYIEEIGSRMNLLPAVFRFYETLGLRISFEKIPVVSMFFSVGFHVWLLIHCAFFTAYKKRYLLFWPLAILLVYTVCSAFVPLVLVRYFAALYLAFPLIMVLTLCPALPRKKA